MSANITANVTAISGALALPSASASLTTQLGSHWLSVSGSCSSVRSAMTALVYTAAASSHSVNDTVTMFVRRSSSGPSQNRTATLPVIVRPLSLSGPLTVNGTENHDVTMAMSIITTETSMRAS